MKKRIKAIELKIKMKAFKFRGIKDLDLIEKYVVKDSDYSFVVKNRKIEININDLTIMENDYIIIKDDYFEIIEENNFNQNYIFKNVSNNK